MRTVARRIASVAISIASIANASAPSRPEPSGPPMPRVVLVASRGASAHLARAQLDRFVQQLDACVVEARQRDPVGLAAVRTAGAQVRLRRDGRADTVEIAPSTLPHGLSACFANVLLGWQQDGIVGTRAAIELRIDVAR